MYWNISGRIVHRNREKEEEKEEKKPADKQKGESE